MGRTTQNFSRGHKQNNGKRRFEKAPKDKLADIICSKSHGRFNKDLAEQIVSQLDCSKSYFVTILRSKQDVANFLSQKQIMQFRKNNEGESVNVRSSFEKNIVLLGSEILEVSEIAVEDGCKVPPMKVLDRKDCPFVCLKVTEVYEMQNKEVNNEVNVIYELGLYA